jgi:nitric oxide synthase-interacting protein
VACSSGSKADILCRECALNDLVAQRKEIKRLERAWEGREVERGEDKRRVQEEGARRELERFERAAQGLGSEDAIVNGAGKKRKASELGPDGGSGDQQHRIENTPGKVEIFGPPRALGRPHKTCHTYRERERH